MKTMFKVLSFAAILAVAAAPAAYASEVFNAQLTQGPGSTPAAKVYFGTGNPNTNFAVNGDGTVQLGLKAAVRGVAQPIVSSGMDYSVTPGQQPHSPGHFDWNFTFSANTGGATLDAYTYLITLTDDAHPAITNTFDPSLTNGNALATSAGVACNGTTPPPCPAYNSATDNGFQNSENLAFGYLPGYGFNSTDEITIVFTATSVGDGHVVTDTINVVPTPEPSSLIFLGTGLLGGLGTMIRRRRIA